MVKPASYGPLYTSGGRLIDNAAQPSGSVSATSTGQTAAVASIATVTSPNDGNKHVYRVSFVVTITTLGSGSINAEVTYTDDNGTARTKIIPLKVTTFAGTMVAAATTADTYTGSEVIAVNPNTAITCLTAGTFTGCTYNVSAVIEPELR